MSADDAFSAFEQEGWASGRAAPYDRGLGHITGGAIESLLDAARVTAGASVLDVATGPGYAAAAAVARGASAVGADLSEEMLAIARSAHPSITFVAAEAGALPFADGTFDAVIANFLMPHVTDLPAVVAEMARLVRPGGRVALTTWDPEPPTFLNALLAAIAATGAVPPLSLPAGPPFFQYAADDEFAALLTGAGLASPEVSTVAFTFSTDAESLWDDLVAGTVRTRAVIEGQPPELRAAIRADYLSRLAAWGASVPVSVKLGAATR